jgi:hypothetical protein
MFLITMATAQAKFLLLRKRLKEIISMFTNAPAANGREFWKHRVIIALFRKKVVFR